MTLRDRILARFELVSGRPYQGTTPDDWRLPLPATFNCSSFVQWIAVGALGWNNDQINGHHPPNVRALRASFPRVDESQLMPGDVLVYRTYGDDEARGDLHCMLYIGGEEVVGACDVEGTVVRRNCEYDEKWLLIEARRIRNG